MLRIGVTGLMASGKSDVATRFVEHGGCLLEGDVLGWEVLQVPDVRARLTRRFGNGIRTPDGGVDRGALGRIVFRDRAAMEGLNADVQPTLERRVREALAAASGEGVLVLDAALIGLWKLEPELDGVVEVTAPAELRVARLRAKGFSEDEAVQRVRGQTLPPLSGARRLWVIENDGTREKLVSLADAVWRDIQRLRSEGSSG